MKRKAFLVLFAILFCRPEGVFAEEDLRANTLKGIEALEVVIESLHPEEGRETGLTREQLQTDVELRLRMIGIRVVSKSDLPKIPGGPFLYVNVNLSGGKGLMLYSIQVELRQWVRLARDPTIAGYGTTWDTAGLGGIRISQSASEIRRRVGDHVDEFLNAYLSVNPK